METKPSPFKDVALVLFPIWGTAAAMALMSVLPKALHSFSWLLYIPWCIGLLLSPSPLIRSDSLGFFGTVVVVVVFGAIATVVVFVTGWVSACAFFKACH